MPKGEVTIRRLSPANVAEYRRLRLFGLKESPTSYGRDHSDVLKEPLSYFRQDLKFSPETWTFGAIREDRLIGIVRLVRDHSRKEKHKASIFGLYVEPRERKKGVALALMQTALDQAQKLKVRQVRLGVTFPNQGTHKLYERLGFKEYGREKDSLFVAGRYYAEILMARRL